MSEALKRNPLIPVFVTAALGLLGYLFVVSAKAGALDQRVSMIESRQSATDSKVDRILESVYRIEGKLERGKR